MSPKPVAIAATMIVTGPSGRGSARCRPRGGWTTVQPGSGQSDRSVRAETGDRSTLRRAELRLTLNATRLKVSAANTIAMSAGSATVSMFTTALFRGLLRWLYSGRGNPGMADAGNLPAPRHHPHDGRHVCVRKLEPPKRHRHIADVDFMPAAALRLIPLG